VNRSNANINLVLCGEVVDDLFFTNTIVPGLQLISYPFNTDIRVSELLICLPSFLTANGSPLWLSPGASGWTY
jgi:uncharacterized membrane protein